MDLGKYVAVGVLAVIVLAAVTYEAPATGGASADASRVTGTFPAQGAGGGGPPDAAPAPAAPAVEAAPVDTSLAPVVPTTPIEAAAAQLPELLRFSVKAGQTLRDVAQEVLGDRGRWREIYERNRPRIPDPDRVRVGTELEFPKDQVARAPQPTAAPAGAAPGAATSVAASAPGGRTHVVARGETLYAIARKELGSGNRWRELVTLNGLRSDQVAAGTVLKLPAR